MKHKLQLLKTMIVLIVVTACSAEKIAEDVINTDCDSVDLFGEASIAAGFYQKALEAYAEEQSLENCQELKQSGNEYIEAVKNYRSCVPDGTPEIDSELLEAQAALADLDC